MLSSADIRTVPSSLSHSHKETRYQTHPLPKLSHCVIILTTVVIASSSVSAYRRRTGVSHINKAREQSE